MLEFLLPHKLVPAAPAAAPVGVAGPFSKAIGSSFKHACSHLQRALWLALPISLLGLLPSIFLLQVYNRVVSRGPSQPERPQPHAASAVHQPHQSTYDERGTAAQEAAL